MAGVGGAESVPGRTDSGGLSSEQPGSDVENAVHNLERSSDADSSESDDDLTHTFDKTSKRPVRAKTLSLVAKESKICEVKVTIVKQINSQFRYLQQLQCEDSRKDTLECIQAKYADIDHNASQIHELYDELCVLCENKVDKPIPGVFNEYNSTVQFTKESLDHRAEELERRKLLETNRSIQQAKDELEEQTRIFEELLKLQDQNLARAQLRLSQEDTTSRPSASNVNIGATSRQDTQAIGEVTALAQIENDRPLQSRVARGAANANKEETVYTALSTSQFQPQQANLSVTTPTASTELSVVKQLTESLAAVIGSNKKSVEPSVFDGNILEFSDWEVDLDTYLRNERIEGHERLRHLKKYIGGEARKCIEGHFTINTNEAYIAARETLKERYGNEHNISRSLRKKLEEWPRIHAKDGQALQEFSDYLCNLQSAMTSIKGLKVLNDCLENEKIVAKVPEWLKIKWAHVISKTQQTEDRYPSFYEFANFVKAEAHVMSLPISQSFASATQQKEKDRKPPKATRSYLSATSEKSKCCCCGLTNHSTTECKKLQGKSKDDRALFVREKGLCFRCLVEGHRSKGCDTKLECKVCHKAHATANHDPDWKPRPKPGQKNGKENSNKSGPETENKTSTKEENSSNDKAAEQKTRTEHHVRATSTQRGISVNTIGVKQNLTTMAIPVYVSAGKGREMLVYALLDNQSDACFISKEVVQTLRPDVTEVEPVKIFTLNGAKEDDINRYDNITLRGYSTDSCATISAYEQHKISVDREQLPTPAKAAKVEHLRSVAKHMPPPLDIPIGLLLGMNFPELLQPLETKPAPDGAIGKPFGVRTLFGWTMCGGSTDRSRRHKTAYKVDLKTETQLLKILERDFCEIEDDDTHMSQDDIKFLKTLKESTKQNAQGNYVMPLPFRTEPDLPNNRAHAEKRLQMLVRKLKSDESYEEEYVNFLNNLITAGHAEEVPLQDLKKTTGVWYMPHFGVRHPKKQKLRVVFDASARFNGYSLNDLLLSGPDHMNSLLGILLRFRREPVAITCDIQQMFHNFLVTPEHRNYLRFLWTDKGLETVKEYRMNVHLFGATSSPGVATFGLRQLADDYSSYSLEASRFLKEDFYVDDGVISVATPEIAKSLVRAATKICSKANIRLHKFVSNNTEVLNSIEKSERRNLTQDVNIFSDKLASERTLGMEWNIESDTFHYTLPTSIKPATKRGILSTVAQIYDPIGLISPIILKGKQILQKVTVLDQPWDQLVPPDVRAEWDRWNAELTRLPTLQVKRCVGTKDIIKRTELHHFSDASLTGYGACSYLRQLSKDGRINCNLVLAKARVAPLKTVTIPRLELQGAVTATRLAKTLRKELKVKVDSEYFWTDSNIALSYISNDVKRFHMYVANRVQEIKQTTKVEQWNHVSTKDNPADLASRGATILELTEASMWFHGPKYLQQANISDYIKQNQTDKFVSEEDPEVRKLKVLKTIKDHNAQFSQRFGNFSSWRSLIRGVAILKHCARRKTWQHTTLSSSDLKESEDFIIKTVQAELFPDKENEKSLSKLHPWVDSKRILRIGGRVHASNDLHELQKHPIIIPKRTHLASLLTKHIHEKIFHLGRRSTLAAIRDAGYWIVDAIGEVKRLINQCVSCARLRKGPQQQLMGQLPTERSEKTPPFTHVGMDVFGHFLIKDRRSEIKRWGLLITCLYSRAVHVELLMDLSTDALINAIRRFTALRGPIKTIYCDNGTNFVGAKNEMQRQLELSNSQLKTYLIDERIEFKMNVPDASHQGGSWERMIRSIRTVLSGMALKYKSRLDTEMLHTAFYEAANIVNSRPLPGATLNEAEETVITPNHLLTMKTNPLIAPAPGSFPSEDIYCKKRWIVTQSFAEEFWRSWKADYLQELNTRQKWTSKKENVKVGDVVLIKDENLPRNLWKLGRVMGTMPGKDGLIRNIEVRVGNRELNGKGKPTFPSTVLKRPIQKVVVLLST